MQVAQKNARRRLLAAESEISLAKAIDQAQTYEQADLNAKASRQPKQR